MIARDLLGLEELRRTYYMGTLKQGCYCVEEFIHDCEGYHRVWGFFAGYIWSWIGLGLLIVDRSTDRSAIRKTEIRRCI